MKVLFVLFVLFHCAYFTFALPLDFALPEGNFHISDENSGGPRAATYIDQENSYARTFGPTFQHIPIRFGVRSPISPFLSPPQFPNDSAFHSEPGIQLPSVTKENSQERVNPISAENSIVKVEELKRMLEETEDIIEKAMDIRQSLTDIYGI